MNQNAFLLFKADLVEYSLPYRNTHAYGSKKHLNDDEDICFKFLKLSLTLQSDHLTTMTGGT